ncbi:leucine-rich repeat neuronal protein 2-like isoform X1 [Neocloeon triangulifer]|uniref:leucine-rich repeat neuronal protein 2-like isoform X1 n=1 Tax=Neocloeon triangulifer TaxID=2078957 RepID=UPI00286F9574|nr:leucine-rich repeat neuronal protein 2-like isoform X1 [Neocloeon triangulifer]
MWPSVGAVVLLLLGPPTQRCRAAACDVTRNCSAVRHLSLPRTLEVVDLTDAGVETLNATLEAPLLRQLTLRSNRLHALPPIAAPRLVLLDVSRNSLRVLPPALRLPQLRTLNLSRNALVALPALFLADAPRLAVLDLSHNALATLPALGVARRTLTHVHLAHNRLVRVDANVLDGVVVSALLDLSHNALRRVPSDALRRAVFVRSVDLAFNAVCHLQPGDLDDVRVAALDLSGQLERVDASAFRFMPFLVNVTLTHSPRLRFLPAGAFDASLPLLRNVNVSWNALLAFEEPASWVDVTLDATHNAFVCHCVLLWLNASMCADASCAPLVLPLFPEEAAVALGAAIELRCVALGAERVRWLRADGGVASNASLLRLQPARRNDSGLLTCEASSGVGASRRSVQLSVTDPNVRLFVLSASATFVTLAWNMSGNAPYVLRWGADASRMRSASPAFPAAPRAHSYTVHGLRPATPYCFALTLDADVTLASTCVATDADLSVGVQRSYVAAAVLALAFCVALAACVALCVVSARPARTTVRRVELIEAIDAAFVIELD